MALVDHKVDVTADTGADLGGSYNDLIDALLTAFDVSSNVLTHTTTPKTDAIAEKTAATGVTVDGCLIKDGNAASATAAFGATGVDDSTIEVASNKLQVKSVLGAWVGKSPATVYLAATDGFVTGYIDYPGNAGRTVRGYTDSSNPPTTMRVNIHEGQYTTLNFLMPVRKGDYWKATTDGGTLTLYWIPMGN